MSRARSSSHLENKDTYFEVVHSFSSRYWRREILIPKNELFDEFMTIAHQMSPRFGCATHTRLPWSPSRPDLVKLIRLEKDDQVTYLSKALRSAE